MKSLFLVFFLAVYHFPNIGFAQDSLGYEFTYDIYRTYPGLSISKADLIEAEKLTDLNKYFKEDWVKEYISVEIGALIDGKQKFATSTDDTLTEEQKKLMQLADTGSQISVVAKYIPENDLTVNDPKAFDFNLLIDPEFEAEFPGGDGLLQEYLTANAFDKISESSFSEHNLTAVKFTINQDGHIVDAHIFQSSNDEEIDQLLLKTVCDMPSWKPAEYSDGTKVNQEFALTAGDMRSCTVNLLNILRLR